MLSQETLEEYRRMTPSQRLELSFASLRFNTGALLWGDREIVARKFELLRRQNDERNRNILAALARLKNNHGVMTESLQNAASRNERAAQ